MREYQPRRRKGQQFQTLRYYKCGGWCPVHMDPTLNYSRDFNAGTCETRTFCAPLPILVPSNVYTKFTSHCLEDEIPATAGTSSGSSPFMKYVKVAGQWWYSACSMSVRATM